MKQIVILLLLPSLLFSQFDFSAGIGNGYFIDNELGELMLEARYSFKLKEKKLYLTPSVVNITDGFNYQTFPRIGLTKYQYNKNKNWNKWTFGLQVYDLDIGNEKITPFVKLTKPIFKLFKDCNCGAQTNKLLTELIVDVTPSAWGVGLGIRKRI
jgi:hypothetical protein